MKSDSNLRYAVFVSTSRPPSSSSSFSSQSSSSSSSSSTAAVTAASSNKPALILCPYTGNILTSVGIGGGGGGVGSGSMGLFAAVPYPSIMSNDDDKGDVFLVYGGPSRDDAYAILVQSPLSTSPSSSSSSSPKWKCRLPEQMDGGLDVSPMKGRFVLGGGKSGKCYLWSALDDGVLLRVWQAHYRSVTKVLFSNCGSYVITGGADGIVNVFSMMDLLSDDDETDDVGGGGGQNAVGSVETVSTWSEHHLPITDLHLLPSNRIISSSVDQHVVVMELFNGTTLARILLPSAVYSVTSDHNGHRLYAGAYDGAMYCVDLDAYAIASTAESATIIMTNENNNSNRVPPREPSLSGTLLNETILGTGIGSNVDKQDTSNESISTTSTSISELRGRNRPVTCIAVLDGGGGGSSGYNGADMIVSGDEEGTIRVWDMRGRVCTRVIRPWGGGGGGATIQNNQGILSDSSKLPSSSSIVTSSRCGRCSSILVLERNPSGLLRRGAGGGEFSMLSSLSAGNRRGKSRRGGGGVVITSVVDAKMSLIRPLKRFLKSPPHDHNFNEEDGRGGGVSRTDDDTVVIVARPLCNDSSSLDLRLGGGGDGDDESFMAKRCRLISSLSSVTSSSSVVGATMIEGNKHVQGIVEDNNDNNTDDNARKKREEDVTSAEVAELRRQLEEANKTIDRWKDVNNKLISKLGGRKKKKGRRE